MYKYDFMASCYITNVIRLARKYSEGYQSVHVFRENIEKNSCFTILQWDFFVTAEV